MSSIAEGHAMTFVTLDFAHKQPAAPNQQQSQAWPRLGQLFEYTVTIVGCSIVSCVVW